MIPIPIERCIKINVENEQDQTYKTLLCKQIHWCNKRENANIILNRAKNLYNRVINKKLPQRIIDRCCDLKC